MERPVPVYILSGFLGSGKTTLLSRAIGYMKERGRKPAVVMNELGEVNLDGLAVGTEVPMAEMLDGCICCTVRGDLGITIQQLILQEEPDVVFIEATGVANPMEILDGVTEASLYMKVELKGVITVVDAAHLGEQLNKGAGKTYRLLEEQIRCAGVLILNKSDLVEASELERLEEALRSWNPYARLIRAVKADADPALLWEEELVPVHQNQAGHDGKEPCSCGHAHSLGCCHDHAEPYGHDCGCGHDHGQPHEHGHDCGHDHGQPHEHGHDCSHEHGQPHEHGHDCSHEHEQPHEHGHDCSHEHERQHPHHSHEHVMVYTRYLNGPVDSTAFEELVGRLPESVYRAKGVLTFLDTANRYLFQYAYRQADFMKITPQVNVPDVVVFIGEQIPKEELKLELDRLEQAAGAPGPVNG